MTNHVDILMTPCAKKAKSNLMQSLGRCYVVYINKTYNRSETLWEGRYKSTLVDSEHYFLTVCRYIELNPVRANMVKHHSITHRQATITSWVMSQKTKRCLQRFTWTTYTGFNDWRNSYSDKQSEGTGWRVSPMPQAGNRKSDSFRERHEQPLWTPQTPQNVLSLYCSVYHMLKVFLYSLRNGLGIHHG
jgi:hypothetical protein